MESVSEVVLPPEEGIEIIRDEQDLQKQDVQTHQLCFRTRTKKGRVFVMEPAGFKKEVLRLSLTLCQRRDYDPMKAPCPLPCGIKSRET